MQKKCYLDIIEFLKDEVDGRELTVGCGSNKEGFHNFDQNGRILWPQAAVDFATLIDPIVIHAGREKEDGIFRAVSW